MADRKLIAPFSTGLETSVAPWLAPEDSFSTLNNMHIKHGAIQKRNGFTFFAALPPNSATIAINNIGQDSVGTVTTGVAHGYNTGDSVFIASVGGMTEVNNKVFSITVNNATEFELNIDTSSFTAYTVGGTAQIISTATDRVMGIGTFIDSANVATLIAWNTTTAYLYNTVSNSFSALATNPCFSGGGSDFIWFANWQSANLINRLYFTNGVAYNGATNGLWYYDSALNTVVSLVPSVGGTRSLYGGKLVFTLRQRLVVLHTFEFDSGTGNTTTYPQRARWCAAQNPNNWNDTTAGGGGFVDAPTGEQIVSARYLQDYIIVFFSDSVWVLEPLSDPALPFRWRRVNAFRSCSGKMASVGYDRYVGALGNRGITASDSNQTKRIDENIEFFTSQTINADEFDKVFCGRSYENKRWWTLYPSLTNTENDSALIFDDDSGAFSTYTVDLNCLGYGIVSEDWGLNDFNATNSADWDLLEAGEATLQDFFFNESEEIFLGGNLKGELFVIENGGDDDGTDISVELFTAGWNPYVSDGREALLSFVDVFLDSDQETTGEISFYKNNDFSPYATQDFDCLPNLGFLASIQNITQANPAQVTAYNHGLTTGDLIYIYLVRGMKEINNIPYTVTVVDTNTFTLDGEDSAAFTAYSGGGGIYQHPFYRDKIWKRIYAGGIGTQHRLQLVASGSDKPLVIHAFEPLFKPVGQRITN